MKKIRVVLLCLFIFSLCFSAFALPSDTGAGKSGTIHKVEYEIFPDGYARYGDHWYIIVRFSESWGYARRQSENAGGSLCCIEDKYEQQFVELLNEDKLGLWLGAHYENGRWNWLNGQEWSYENWAKGFPVSDPEGQRVALRPDKWYTLGFNETYLIDGFIVEFNSEQLCLDALNAVEDGGFFEFGSPVEEAVSTVAPISTTNAPEPETVEPFPIEIAVIAVFLFLFAAAFALVIITKNFPNKK